MKFLVIILSVFLFLSRDEAQSPLSGPLPSDGRESPLDIRPYRGQLFAFDPLESPKTSRAFAASAPGYKIKLSDIGVGLEVGTGREIELEFPGADLSRMRAEDTSAGRKNSYLGNDSEHWVADSSRYKQVRYAGFYEGIDVVFHGDSSGNVEYDFVVAPRADYHRIAMRFGGDSTLHISGDGELDLFSNEAHFTFSKPVAYQTIGNQRIRRDIAYRTNHDVLTFEVGSYNPDYPLTIDPTIRLVYSSYLGGTELEYFWGMAVDAAGRIYLGGQTFSQNFPKSASDSRNSQLPPPGNGDCFVSVLDPHGTSVVYTTFLGGKGNDECGWSRSLAIDEKGNVYVTGSTESEDFPIRSAYRSRGIPRLGTPHAFLAKLDPTGRIVYSTLFGGTAPDFGRAIAIDLSGNAYIAGTTDSPDLVQGDAAQRSYGGFSDSFVAKFNTTGDRLVYATYIGGTDVEDTRAITVDALGSVIVVGATRSTDFPVYAPFESSLNGPSSLDGFVTKLNPAGNAFLFSTYLGGTGNDFAISVNSDEHGDVYVGGYTGSADFPTTPNGFQIRFGGGFSDGFLAKLSSSGNTLLYSTYFGGNGLDTVNAIASGTGGTIYLAGETTSSTFGVTSFPVKGALPGQDHLHSSYDAYVAKLDTHKPVTDQLSFSTYLGGNGNSFALSLALAPRGKAIFVAGYTGATNFPTKVPLQGELAGGIYDGFVAKISEAGGIFLR